jgi:HPt (histidine-containing phosphotransfer) domain-containing protein
MIRGDIGKRFHNKNVRKEDSAIIIKLNFDLLEINENGILIKSSENISNGTLISIDKPILSEACQINGPLELYVKSGEWINENCNHLFLEFDTINTEMKKNIRKWIMYTNANGFTYPVHTSEKETKLEPFVDDIPDELKELIPEYIDTHKKEVLNMIEFLKNNDYKAIQNIAHMIAGNAGSLGFTPFGELAKKLELEAMRGKNFQLMNEYLNNMNEYINRVKY